MYDSSVKIIFLFFMIMFCKGRCPLHPRNHSNIISTIYHISLCMLCFDPVMEKKADSSWCIYKIYDHLLALYFDIYSSSPYISIYVSSSGFGLPTAVPAAGPRPISAIFSIYPRTRQNMSYNPRRKAIYSIHPRLDPYKYYIYHAVS